MYVCVCNAVKESEVREMARKHPGASTEELYARLGIQVDCGSCLSFADGLVAEENSSISPLYLQAV